MKVLHFTDQNFTVNVKVKTDLVNDSQENFTIMSVEDLDATEKSLGLGFKSLPTNLVAVKKFATDNDLKLTVINLNGVHSSSVLVQHSGSHYNSGLGLDNI